MLPYITSGEWDYMLDSGCFTFLTNDPAHITFAQLRQYSYRYAEHVRDHKLPLYVEMDIDKIYGYKAALELRSILERIVQRPCIPVWHTSRGKDDFIQMCKEYDYVAFGAFLTDNFSRKLFKYIPWFIDTAHEHGAKIHGLGFTHFDGLPRYHFDSVDSTSWVHGNAYGFVFKFDRNKVKILRKPSSHRIAHPASLEYHNFKEWVRFQRYAEKYL